MQTRFHRVGHGYNVVRVDSTQLERCTLRQLFEKQPPTAGRCMRIAIEVSLYPLQAPLQTDGLGLIKKFLERLSAYPDLHVATNAMSTQISGEHAAVFAMLERETARTFEQGGRSVFVMKVLGGG